jgi:NADH-quinone oxidoreductase subunit J
MLEPFLFFLFGILALGAGVGMLTARSPVNSALWLVLNLFSVACLYLTLHASFLAIIQILVYAGAIMVLFLFVIMLLNLTELPEIGRLPWKRIGAFGLGMIVLAQIFYTVSVGLEIAPKPVSVAEAAQQGSVSQVGRELFTTYALPLEVTGILLLAATVGAVLLAKKRFE